MMNVIEKNNVNIVGSGDQTIIMAHGFGTDQTVWNPIVNHFKDRYKIILYDNTGAGKSDPKAFSPNKYSNLYMYSEDLIDICKSLNIKDAIVIAHSVSGMISLLASIRKPEYFSKVITIGASPRYLNDENYIGGFSQDDLNSFYDAMANNYFAWVSGFAPAAMCNLDKPYLAESFATTLLEIRPDIAQSVSKVIFQSDHRKDLQKVNKETLIIQATDDIAVPDFVGNYLHENIKDSKYTKVSAKGHFPHISAPDQIIDAVENFI